MNTWTRGALVLAWASGLGCQAADRTRPSAYATSSAEAASSPKLSLDDCAPPPPQERAHGGALRWYVDDFPAASACALKLGRPIAIDLWAPWCHTCLSMQQRILADAGLADFAERFVWLTVDTDRASSEAVVAKYPSVAWPTFYVVEPKEGRLLARLVGGASLGQFKAFLIAGLEWGGFESSSLEGTRPEGAGKDSAGGPQSLAALIAKAHTAESKRAWAEAGRLYDRALAGAPRDWSRRPDTLVSRLRAYVRGERCVEGLAFAKKEGLNTGSAASAADFTHYVLRCAKQVPFPDPTLLDDLADHVLAAIDGAAEMSVDDRSDALRILREVALYRGRPDRARALALRQRRLLDESRVDAPPLEAMTYNWPAAEVYAFLGEAEALVPALEANMKALPKAYDPPYRLAWVLLKAGRPEKARGHAERALRLVYGPRKARVYDLLADIEAAAGRPEAERRARAETVEVLASLPPAQAQPDYLKAAKQRLAAMGVTPK